MKKRGHDLSAHGHDLSGQDQSKLLQEHAGRLKRIVAKHKAGKKLTQEELEILGARGAGAGQEEVYDSIKAAAAALGVPKYVIQRAKASGQCTDAFRGSRVYITENLKLWLEAADVEPTDQDKGYWEACIAKQKFEHLEWENARARGEFVTKKAFASDLMELGSEQKALVRQKLENEYPGLCPGMEPGQRAELKKLGRELADEICRRMQRLVEKWS